ncbi:MAG TPA: flagellar hook protein [Verrucomicrobiales bacterium]|nr:flagellar hook protein [Verrucomicrobiales bacterium]
MELGVSGLASGFDWRALVDQLVEVERSPQRLLLQEQSATEQRSTAYGALRTQLSVLQNRVNDLKDPALFSRRLTTVGTEATLKASASGGTALGSYTFDISQLATAAVQQGTSNIGARLHPTNDVSSLALKDAPFSTAVSAGSFSVNGKQVTIATTDSLQDVFDRISTATGGTVTGSYDSLADKITLSSGGNIVLGSATDTSNFLSVARLQNNGSGTVTSTSTLGTVRSAVALGSSNLTTAVSDGGSGAGEFKINGVSIAFDAAADSLKNVIDRINASAAGVTASYDPVNDRMTLTNKVTGNLGIGLEDVTGNFLAATGLSGGSLTNGKNLEYSINGGGTLVSASNTITESTSGLTGLTITALAVGSSTVEVKSDSAAIKKAITGFLDEYNKTQGLIDKETSSSTDSKGKVTAGTLAGQSDANEIATKLRGLAFGSVSGISGTIDRLAQLGIDTNGDNNNLTLTDAARLDDALLNELSSVSSLFTDATNGVASRLHSYLESTVGDEGSLNSRITGLATQSTNIDKQIADMERIVQGNRQAMIDQFVLMEQAQSRINQQLQYLQRNLGNL